MNLPLSAPSVRTDNDGISPLFDLCFDVFDHDRLTIQVVYWDIEESLDLTRMQVDSNNMVTSGCSEHIGNEFCGNRCTALVLFVLPSIRIAGNDCRNSSGRCGTASRNENEKLHEIVVHVRASRLDDKDVFVSDRLLDFDVYLPIGKGLDVAR